MLARMWSSYRRWELFRSITDGDGNTDSLTCIPRFDGMRLVSYLNYKEGIWDIGYWRE